MNTLSNSQFVDLALYIIFNGKHSSFPGLDSLKQCKEIYSQKMLGECDVIFIKDGWPYALYESSRGFYVLPVQNDIPLTQAQYDDLYDWISGFGLFSATLSVDALRGCETIQPPDCEEAIIDSSQIFVRNKMPVALQYGDEGFFSVPNA